MGTINFRKDVFQVLHVKTNKNPGQRLAHPDYPRKQERKLSTQAKKPPGNQLDDNRFYEVLETGCERPDDQPDAQSGEPPASESRAQTARKLPRNTVTTQSPRFTSLAGERGSNRKLTGPEKNRGPEVILLLPASREKVTFLCFCIKY